MGTLAYWYIENWHIEIGKIAAEAHKTFGCLFTTIFNWHIGLLLIG